MHRTPINFLKIFVFGLACFLTPKAIANPTPTTILLRDSTVAAKSSEILPSQVADSNSWVETEPALPQGSASRLTPVESSSFNAQISRSARDLLPDEVKASGFMTAQTDSLPSEDSTTSDPSNLAEPTESADNTPKEDSTEAASVTELAKKAQNPIANLISLPFQNNTNFGVGSLDRTQNVLNIQPVIPVSLSDDLLLITRTIVPVIYQPEPPTGGGGTLGLGDMNPQFYSTCK